MCNFSAGDVAWSGLPGTVREVVLSTTGRMVRDFVEGVVRLAPYEAVAVLC